MALEDTLAPQPGSSNTSNWSRQDRAEYFVRRPYELRRIGVRSYQCRELGSSSREQIERAT